jgi:hypothetical protein
MQGNSIIIIGKESGAIFRPIDCTVSFFQVIVYWHSDIAVEVGIYETLVSKQQVHKAAVYKLRNILTAISISEYDHDPFTDYLSTYV